MLAWVNCNVFIFNWLLGWMGWIAIIKLQILTRFSINSKYHFMCIIRFSHFQTHIKSSTQTHVCHVVARIASRFFCPQLHNRYISNEIFQLNYLSTNLPTEVGHHFFLEVHPQRKLQIQHPSGRFCWKSLFPAQRRRCCSRPLAILPHKG